MPKLPILTAKKAESLLIKAGFAMIRSKGSHRIYKKDKTRMILPFHPGKNLHPKIVKQVFEAVK